jgi:hypothetical protein
MSTRALTAPVPGVLRRGRHPILTTFRHHRRRTARRLPAVSAASRFGGDSLAIRGQFNVSPTAIKCLEEMRGAACRDGVNYPDKAP